MIEFQVDVSDLQMLARMIPELGTIILDEMDKAMEESGMLLTAIVSQRVMAKSSDTGLLAASISWPSGFESTGEGLSLTGYVRASQRMGISGVSTALYSNWVEFGTRPHWPPREPLRLWAEHKFGDETIGDRVAAAIAARGTYAKRNFFLAWHYNGGKVKVAEIWRKLPVKVIQRWDGLS